MEWVWIDFILFVLAVFIFGRITVEPLTPEEYEYEKEKEYTSGITGELTPRKRAEKIGGYFISLSFGYLFIKYILLQVSLCS